MKKVSGLLMLMLVWLLVALPVSADSLERSNPETIGVSALSLDISVIETKIINKEEVFLASYPMLTVEENKALVAYSKPDDIPLYNFGNDVLNGIVLYNDYFFEAILVSDTSKKIRFLMLNKMSLPGAKGGSVFSRCSKPEYSQKYKKIKRLI